MKKNIKKLGLALILILLHNNQLLAENYQVGHHHSGSHYAHIDSRPIPSRSIPPRPVIIQPAPVIVRPTPQTNMAPAIIAGAIGGAIIGSQINNNSGEIAFRNNFGGLIDRSINLRLDHAARDKIIETAYFGLSHGKLGQSYQWRTFHYSGSFTPTENYTYYGNSCRKFKQIVNSKNKSVKIFGSACRTANGGWKVNR